MDIYVTNIFSFFLFLITTLPYTLIYPCCSLTYSDWWRHKL